MQMVAKKAKKYSGFFFCHWLPLSGPDWKTGHRSAVSVSFECQLLWEVQQSQNWHKHQVAGLRWEARFYRQCICLNNIVIASEDVTVQEIRWNQGLVLFISRPLQKRGFGRGACPRLLFLIPIPLPYYFSAASSHFSSSPQKAGLKGKVNNSIAFLKPNKNRTWKKNLSAWREKSIQGSTFMEVLGKRK